MTPERGVLYFAYASNMDAAQMRASCPGAQLVHPCARLDDHELDFRRWAQRWQAGVADIVARNRASVFGCVWELPQQELHALDDREGVWATPPAYRRLPVRLAVGGELIDAFSYTVVVKSPAPVAPTPAYARLITDSARALGLPPEYRAALASTLAALGVSP